MINQHEKLFGPAVTPDVSDAYMDIALQQGLPVPLGDLGKFFERPGVLDQLLANGYIKIYDGQLFLSQADLKTLMTAPGWAKVYRPNNGPVQAAT
jgi:hypothetical protein